MATDTRTTTTNSSPVNHLTAILGTQGVMLGKLAILSPGPTSIVTPGIAALVTTKAVLVNRGTGVRLVMASSVNPITNGSALPTTEGRTWGPITLAPGAMTQLPAPATGLAWFVVDVSQRELRDLAWAGWLTVGFAVFGAGAGAYFTIKDIRRHMRQRRATRGRRT